MMKFQCSFLALFIKSYALPFKINSLSFEVAYFVCSANTLVLSLSDLPPLLLFLRTIGSGFANAPGFLTYTVLVWMRLSLNFGVPRSAKNTGSNVLCWCVFNTSVFFNERCYRNAEQYVYSITVETLKVVCMGTYKCLSYLLIHGT